MKFFKHFTDAHRGTSIQAIRKKYDWNGVGRYWTLVELCAEKLSKDRDEEYTIEHCVFEFEKSYLMRILGYGNLLHTSSYLSALSVIGLCSVCETPVAYLCSMPKLLECMDRDTKKARPERGQSAPKIKNKIKNKNISSMSLADMGRLLSENGEDIKPTALELVELWNEASDPSLAKVVGISVDRERKARARLKEHPDAETWSLCINKINNSNFCLGKIKSTNRSKPWKADFDWLIKPGTIERVLEGKYDNK